MAYTDQILKQSLGQLSGIGAGALPGPGGTDISKASDFFRTLLGGSRQQIMQQASPGLNLALDQAAGARRAAARGGTARTGGTAAAQAEQQDAAMKNIDTLIGSQQSTAADKLANIGSTELQTMMNALNIGSSVAQQDVASRRAASAQMWSSLIGGAASIATGGMLGGFGGLLKGATKATQGVPAGIAAPNPAMINTPIPWTPPTFGYNAPYIGPYAP